MAVINVICDDRMIDRQLPLLEELIRQKAPYIFWDIVEDKNSVVASINKSHKRIVQFAKDNNLPEILIGEDDLMFPANDGYQYFLRNKPEDYDLYLAATYTLPITNNIVCGFHLYFIHSRFYDTFLATPDDVHIDSHMTELNGKYVFCYPMAALQRPGRSANNPGEKVNYNNQLKAEDVYGKFK
jgi:hypothetical protein